jgi:hypothetical protein
MLTGHFGLVSASLDAPGQKPALGATAAGLILGYIGLHEYLSQHPSLGRSWTDILG